MCRRQWMIHCEGERDDVMPSFELMIVPGAAVSSYGNRQDSRRRVSPERLNQPSKRTTINHSIMLLGSRPTVTVWSFLKICIGRGKRCPQLSKWSTTSKGSRDWSTILCRLMTYIRHCKTTSAAFVYFLVQTCVNLIMSQIRGHSIYTNSFYFFVHPSERRAI